MADKKISALTNATTPLAGTEVLPIVQNNSTVKTSVETVLTSVQPSGAAYGVQFLNINKQSTTSANFTYSGSSIRNSSSSALAKLEIFNDQPDNTTVNAPVGSIDFYVSNTALKYSSIKGYVTGAFSDQAGLAFYVNNAASYQRAALLDSSKNLTLDNGNLVQGTAAKGVNFTANTPKAGMTSQLLNWYEEGTWTPNQGAGLTVTGTFSSSGSYTRAGKMVTVNFRLQATTSISVTGVVALFSNLPFAAISDTIGGFGAGTNASGSDIFHFQLSGTTAFLEGGNIAATNNIYGSATYMTT